MNTLTYTQNLITVKDRKCSSEFSLFRQIRSRIESSQSFLSLLLFSAVLPVFLLLIISPATVNASQVQWVLAGDGDWETAANWSDGIAPGPGDSVVVTNGSTITHSSGTSQINGLTMTGNLIVLGGSLTVNGTVQIAGALSVNDDAALIADGPLATIDVTQSASIDNGNIFALNGARITLPGATNLQGNGLLRAQGQGSRLELANLGSVGINLPGPLIVGEGFTREISVYHDADTVIEGPELGIVSADSREYSLFHKSQSEEMGVTFGIISADSREYALYHQTDFVSSGPELGVTNTASREYSLYLRAPIDPGIDGINQAISRELSTEHLTP